MRYLHTMLRVADPEAAVRFFTLLGLKETRASTSRSVLAIRCRWPGRSRTRSPYLSSPSA